MSSVPKQHLTVRCHLYSIPPNVHDGIFLPHKSPVSVGRSKETKIHLRSCSRNQLELLADYDNREVTVTRRGHQTSQVGTKVLDKNTDYVVKPGEILFVCGNMFPHEITFSTTTATDAAASTSAEETKSAADALKETAEESDKMAGRKRVATECVDTLGDEATDKVSVRKQVKLAPGSGGSGGSWNGWSGGLRVSMKDEAAIVMQNETLMVIRDKYPKAKHHWLVIPREAINKPRDLNASHVHLLELMIKVGQEICERITTTGTEYFRLGFHAIPSMRQVHMHVISNDLNSPCLKTKKHYNSFTTDFFVDAKEALKQLTEAGKVDFGSVSEDLLKKDLRCHLCGHPQKNMPTLKHHLDKGHIGYLPWVFRAHLSMVRFAPAE